MYYVSCKLNIMFIIECNLSLQAKKTTHFLMYFYMTMFLCFDVKNSLLKYVQAF